MMKQNKVTSFKCYFCNKIIENETEVGHNSVCLNVLVSCPNKCGSYIPRQHMNKHKHECLNNPNPRRVEHDLVVRPPQYNSLPKSTSMDLLFENDKHVNHLTMQIENIKLANNNMNNWKTNIDLNIEKIREYLKLFENFKYKTESALSFVQNKIQVNEEQFNMKLQKNLSELDMLLSQKIANTISSSSTALNAYFDQNFHNLVQMIKEIKEENTNVTAKVNEIKTVLDELSLKVTNVVFDLKAVSQTASESEEKIEKNEREQEILKRDMEQIKMDIQILEDQISSHNMFSSPGSLIWKIKDITSKFEIGKQTDCFIKSPIFFSHHYGYKLRMYMYLNGLNKWKDRYALICLHVMKGEFDLLLKWPCHIEGVITLRDLEHKEQPSNFSKKIVTKKQFGGEENEDPQESSPTYIFIPHNVLFKEKFQLEDTLFLEIKIERTS